MEIIKTLIWVIQIISAVAVIVLVLLQHGKGADAGATFGSGGGSGSLFGASGSANFLSRTTAIFATVFFVATFGLVLLSSNGRVGDAGVMAGLNGKIATSSPLTGANASSSATQPAKDQKNQIPQ
ncbi:MAG: preprotein translocase subunit SecG [Pseudomonadota bacterium]|nr:preprotein translocase subunit SecG [Pseudomonadota bacterium]